MAQQINHQDWLEKLSNYIKYIEKREGCRPAEIFSPKTSQHSQVL